MRDSDWVTKHVNLFESGLPRYGWYSRYDDNESGRSSSIMSKNIFVYYCCYYTLQNIRKMIDESSGGFISLSPIWTDTGIITLLCCVPDPAGTFSCTSPTFCSAKIGTILVCGTITRGLITRQEWVQCCSWNSDCNQLMRSYYQTEDLQL